MQAVEMSLLPRWKYCFSGPIPDPWRNRVTCQPKMLTHYWHLHPSSQAEVSPALKQRIKDAFK